MVIQANIVPIRIGNGGKCGRNTREGYLTLEINWYFKTTEYEKL